MDLVSSCKQKLAFFRIKELKDVLAQLGLSKQGKKQDLVDRILFSLSDEQLPRMWAKKNAVGKEEIAKLVEDAYRKMHRSGAPDLASKGHAGSDTSSMRPKEEVEDLYQPEYLIRCPCGSSLMSDSMIKCDDPKCHVWQHMSCVLIPEKPNEGLPHPEIFYCEICRLNRADPFWVPVAHPLHPVKLNATNIPADSTNPIQSAEKTFQLTRADKDLLSKQEYDVQAWCMLLNDKVLFRMQWPQYADLQVNGMPVRAVNRPGSQLLGTNGRDDGPIISSCTREGVNKISLTGCDARVFCLGVRIVKRRSVQQILNLIPKQSDGEPLEEALARVRRCVSGGSSADNADSDSDLEVVADCIGVNLRCPMSGSRMKVVGRFKPCIHMGCFDLEIFVEMNQRSRKWQCPICLRNYTLQDLIIDPYFNRITSMVRYCGEEVTEIEVKPDGSWRIKTKSENERRDHGDLAQWHFPDGSLCSGDKGLNKVEGAKQQQIKQEAVSEGHTGLKLGIRKNRNGLWEVSKPDFDPLSSGNKLVENYGNFSPKIIPMSSSASGSGRDGEDPSVNQEGGGNFDFSNNNGIELDSVSLNINAVSEFANRNPSSLPGGAEVIVLSDSEEENHAPVPSGSIFQNNQSDVRGINFSVPHPEISTSYPDDPTLGFFNGNDDEFEMPIWSMPSGPQARPGFQLFSSDTDALADMQHNSTAAASGFTLGAETAVSSAALIADSSCTRANPDMNDGLLDNSLAFSGNDPSLQIFLPTRPSDGPAQPELREQGSGSNGIHTEDWISLRLGGGAGGSHSASMSGYGSNSRKQLPPREGGMDTLADTASLLLGMNNSTSDRASRQRPDSPFSFPRQKRSVRPRLYLSIDSDTE